MNRAVVVNGLVVLLSSWIVSPASAADFEKSAALVRTARTKCEAELGRLTDTLIAGIDKALDAARQEVINGTASREKYEVLRRVKNKFLAAGRLPAAEVLPTLAERYERAILLANEDMERTYEQVIASAREAQLDDLVAELESERESWRKGLGRRYPTRVSSWEHTVNNDPGSRQRFDFYSDGTIARTDRPDIECIQLWSLKGRVLEIRSRSTEAPNGVWVDVAEVAEDGKSYAGKNQWGVSIKGVRIEPTGN